MDINSEYHKEEALFSCDGFPAHISEKSIQSCEDHCINTAQYAMERLQQANLGKTSYLAGLIHDCGKFTEDFREYIVKAALDKKVKKGSVIHTFAGPFCMLENHHGLEDCKSFNAFTAEIIAYAAGAHHSLFNCIGEDHKNGFVHRLNRQPEYEKQAIKNFYERCCSKEQLNKLFSEATHEMENISSDIATIAKSNKELYFYFGLITRLIVSAVIDGDRRDTAEFMAGKDFGKCIKADPELWTECRDNINSLIDGFTCETKIDKARREMSDICSDHAHNPPGIYRLNIPTGGGKTLSSMRYAVSHAEQYGKKHIIYAAPFLTILEQNSKVIREALGNDDIILEHHSNIVNEDKCEEELSVYDLLAETWDSPVIITTIVQLLNTMFSGKTSCIRRFHSLCDSVIIIDEVQSISLNILSMFNLTINFLNKICGATIILCSATQPCFDEMEKHRMLISDRDIIPQNKYKEFIKIFKRTELLDAGNMTLEQITDFADNTANKTNSLLTICNTKKEAVKVFNSLKNKHKNCEHLSASMCIAHRDDVLGKVFNDLDADKKTVLVSTRIIDSGVHVSFEAVIQLMAGMDNAVQAAGRCNRNGEKDGLCPVYIVRCENERLGSLKDIARAQNATNDLLNRYSANMEAFDNDLASDRSIRCYYKNLYGLAEKNLFDYPVGDTTLFDLLSDNPKYTDGGEEAGQYIFHQAFKTAGEKFEVIGQDTKTVIVPYGEEGKRLTAQLQTEKTAGDLNYMKKLLDKAKKYSVAIYDNQIEQLLAIGGIREIAGGKIMILNEDHYDNKTGVTIEPIRKEAVE